MNETAFSNAVWGELWLKVKRELEAQDASLNVQVVDDIVDYRIARMAENLVELLDKP